MALTQLKFPADIGTGSTQYRYVTFSIGVAQESAQDKLTEASKDTITNLSNDLGTIGNTITDSLPKSWQDGITELKNTFGSADVSLTGAIMLPLPNAMEDNQQHRWEEQEGLVAKIGGALTKTGDDVIGKIPGVKSLNVDAEYTLKYLNMQAGKRQFTTNPSYWQMYKGSTPRDIGFTWIFVPRTSAESSLIQEVVLAFKKFSSPEKLTNGFLFKSPYIWTVKFSNPKITNMLALKKLVCTQVQVSYGEGSMSLFKDGMPKYIQMTVSFHECTVSTAEDFNSSLNAGSVTSGTSSTLGSSVESATSSATGGTSMPTPESSSASTIMNTKAGSYKS